MVHRVWEWDQSAGLTDGGVVDVVVSGNHPKVEWGQVNLFLHSNALEVKGGVERGNKTGCTMSSTTATKEALFWGSAKCSSSSRILYCNTEDSGNTVVMQRYVSHLGLFQIWECVLHKLWEVVRQVAVGHTCVHVGGVGGTSLTVPVICDLVVLLELQITAFW